MNRFWVFPLVLDVVFAVGATVVATECVEPSMYSYWHNAGRAAHLWRSLWDGFAPLAPWGLGIGVLLGAIAGGFDTILNAGKRRGGRQLVGNVAWCLAYAHLPITLFVVFECWLSFHPKAKVFMPFYVLFVPLLFWLVAIGWATVRTICAPDVLSPRVLADKLRRSVQLEE